MRIIRLTPELAEAAGRALARAMAWFSRIREQLLSAVLQVTEAIQPLVRLAEQLLAATAERPAWTSPYGPAPRRN